MTPQPFRIAIPDSAIKDLHTRLDNTRLPSFIERAGWSYGVEPTYLKSLLHSWRHEFDWRAEEANLNQWPHFKLQIDGINIHYIHVRGKGPNPLPLILTHGWPSSFVELTPLIGPLTDPINHGGKAEDAFDVIIPSMPGYGFSDISTTPGMSPYRVHDLWAKLMSALGYTKWGAHGCDIGAHVTALMGLAAPPGLIGIHMGYVPIPPNPRRANTDQTEQEKNYLAHLNAWREKEIGYVEIQRTKPHTLSVGLADSPAGLAAWIAEKWRSWSICDDTPEKAIPRNLLLTNIALYWFTNTIGSSVRYYYETFSQPRGFEPDQRITLPCGFFLEATGAGANPKTGRLGRPGPPSRSLVEQSYNVNRWFETPDVGHFPAPEASVLLASELRRFFGNLH